ncbi:uncharacterized protein HD556DRAFT_1369186 [Suillus plorans]|uniref:Uncharacterized protein n=1 Tax=Suillus plorans TaxID=116603 RepID=A0A9P7ARF7_9AGAM|nr:uncharacterized protein HD556DRAFT_1369186 [Suillus plorans]KAG1794666.1 hypothetical protein HD556DRAFT_1369186 [Suillus plorans]
MMPQPPLVPSRFRPYPPEVYVYCYQQYLHATGQVPGPPNPVLPPPPPPHHLGGYPAAFQGMGVPPAAAPLQHPSAPPLAQPSHDTYLEQQAPVADAEESAIKRGKRKAVDLDDDDAPPRKKQTIHPIVDYDFELVQNNGEVRYRCCLPQCENVPAVPRAGIQDHIKSKKHQQVRARSPSLEYVEAFEETTDLTSSESLEPSDNSLDETTNSGWDEGFNDFFDIEAACEPVSGEQIEESVNNPEETIDSALGSLADDLYAIVDSASDEQLDESTVSLEKSLEEPVNSASDEQLEELTDSPEKGLHEMDNLSPEELLLFRYYANRLDEAYNFN